MTRPCVYRCYSATGELLYVGCTIRAARRIERHRYDTKWFLEVATITVTHFELWDDALNAEMLAIVEESPKYNVLQSTDPPAARRAVEAIQS